MRVDFLQLLYLENLYAQEFMFEDIKVGSLDAKRLVDIELVKSFRDKEWF